MENKMRHHAVVTPQGALRLQNRTLFEESIRNMSRDADYPVVVEVRPRKRFRSDVQNAYYWGVCVHMVCQRLREIGHDVDKDLTHEFLKGRFLYTEMIDPETNEVMKIPRKTSDLSTQEFIDYTEQVKQFAAEKLDLFIPDPNDNAELAV
jgi:hypothetical protein